jgi:hypothetical protein
VYSQNLGSVIMYIIAEPWSSDCVFTEPRVSDHVYNCRSLEQ